MDCEREPDHHPSCHQALTGLPYQARLRHVTWVASVNHIVLNRPIAVFDAGIGSYAIARKIADRFPGQDVLYFADRANFPYGGKSRAELLGVMRATIERLEIYSPAAVVIASNAPSVMVLDELRASSRTPL